MNGGSQFVENLKKLNYPKVSRLKGEDFDWLFETPEHKQFLRWFCAHARKRNVLSAEEVGAFAAFEASGQAILDEAALAKVLKTCRGAEPEGGPASLRDLDPAQLEDELQALRREKRLKLQRRGQLQVMAAGAAGAAYRLGAQREEASAALKETLESLGAENAKMNRELQLLVEEARQLTAFFSAGPEREAGAPPSGPPVFLSQLALGPYLHQEELNTKALALYTQKQFFRGISDLVESSNEENFQLLDLSGSSERGEDNQVQQGRRKEMAKLQCTHIMAQHRLIQARAKEESTRAGLQWIRDNLHSTSKAKPSGSASVLQVRAAGLWQELEGVRAQARALLRERIPAALRASAQLLYMPVVRGDLDLQIARQDYYTSRQDEVCRHLLRQKASFELLQLACELELRRGRQLDRQLGDLTQRLQGSGQELGRRLEVFSQPALSAGARPRNVIDSRDTACSRLYQVLEGAAGQEQPIRTYGGLEQAAQALRQELRAAREAVEGAAEEQRRCLAGAEADCELLRSTNYCGLKQLVLTPQVRAAPQDHFTRSQELGESLLQLESQLNTLNQLMQEISSDVKAKKTLLERRKLQRLERDLYVYFFQDEDLLKSIVKELENKVKAVAGAQGD
uniref:HAUS augmin-like complex, subunit 3 n=1 Tax=Lepisosteus oculatus TaxID=7918 RepID=W5M2Q1_LEPOC|nr:PREDICTED: HAUS augmin-like complex subunit 3 isoform X1 [Lepisosteus oculatus]XP_015199441.1 PREDICTED: HAUS augmin-like complex subunit 3 isoform X1 [Lepisosteus oculatus]XP_015199442.1 PREDICTED: HAUS augmin-like complex subunit 3 isoform X1 [Lepisosteus oculatus]XP_015199443.1 PREDICTED: HAUS augmin-like complex subunit 3 isoform X1 [Lepisosteus oculatus]XP_015199444.1 PREDICTED: HAUS augmin-like complex subunit 3 isoform X1 [Lepisosteus oculatus]XP_015199445.1 PREDICTED: HAUS augmin-li